MGRQGLRLQVLDSVSAPLGWQGRVLPTPYDVMLHVRLWKRTPLPHVTLHWPHALHALHCPGTVVGSH